MNEAPVDPVVQQLREELDSLLTPRYTIEQYLKSGGAGAVFKIREKATNVSRVAKILRPEVRDVSAIRQEFLTEAQKLAALRHPNLVTVFEQSQLDKTPYFIMEYIEGQPLDKAVQTIAKDKKDGKWVYDVRKILLQLADVLAYLHSREGKLLHLDIKPDNIHLNFTYRGAPLPILLDFGISRFEEHAPAVAGAETLAFGTFSMWPQTYKDKCLLRMTHTGRTLFKIDRAFINTDLDLHLLGKTLAKVLDVAAKESAEFSAWDPAARAELAFLRGVVKQLDIDDTTTAKLTSAADLRVAIRRLELRASRAGYRLDRGLLRIPGRTITSYGDKVRSLTDWPGFQRLRGVRQLGLAFLVYPGATHTRFEHSLGVFDNTLAVLDQLAGPWGDQRFRALVSDEELVATVIVGLLHDVGHYPLGHDFSTGFDFPVHEARTRDVIESEELRGRVIRHFNEDVYNAVLTLIRMIVAIEVPGRSGGSAKPLPHMGVLRTIISSSIDVDKLDYVGRDSLHAGVPYGNIVDRERFLASLRVWWDSDGVPHLVLSDKGRVCAEALVFARYLMTSEVYWNHGVRAFTAMVTAALDLFGADEIKPHLWDTDDVFLGWLRNEERSHWLDDLLAARKPYRRAFVLQRLGGKEFDPELDRLLFKRLEGAVSGNRELLRTIQSEVASALCIQEPRPHEIVLDVPRGTTWVGGVKVLPEGHEEPGSVGPIFDAIGLNFDGFGRKARIFVHPRHMGGRSLTESTRAVRKALVSGLGLG